MDFNKKQLVVKPSSDIWEIAGFYPSGQAGNTEDQYIIAKGNTKVKLTKAVITELFENYQPKQTSEEIINYVNREKEVSITQTLLDHDQDEEITDPEQIKQLQAEENEMKSLAGIDQDPAAPAPKQTTKKGKTDAKQ